MAVSRKQRSAEVQLTPVYWTRSAAIRELLRLRQLLSEYDGLRTSRKGRGWVVVGTRRASANPIPSRWTSARVMRTRRGEVKIMLPLKSRGRRKNAGQPGGWLAPENFVQHTLNLISEHAARGSDSFRQYVYPALPTRYDFRTSLAPLIRKRYAERKSAAQILSEVKRLAGTRNPRLKSPYRVVRGGRWRTLDRGAKRARSWIIVNRRGEQVGALAGYTTKRIALERARGM